MLAESADGTPPLKPTLLPGAIDLALRAREYSSVGPQRILCKLEATCTGSLETMPWVIPCQQVEHRFSFFRHYYHSASRGVQQA